MDAKQLYEKYMITSMVAGFEPVVVESRGGLDRRGRGRQAVPRLLQRDRGRQRRPRAPAGHRRGQAADGQARPLALPTFTTITRAAELAEKLAEVTPGRLQKSFFGNCGAEAIEGVLRLAKQFTKRQETRLPDHEFSRPVGRHALGHGQSGTQKGYRALSVGRRFLARPLLLSLSVEAEIPAVRRACAEFIDHVLQYQTAGGVAAFIAEPVLGEGGIIVPPPEYFQIAVEIVRRDGVLFIVDEGGSGFGRTGKLFAIEHYGVEPDILCMAKGIADGFPLTRSSRGRRLPRPSRPATTSRRLEATR